MKRRGQVALVLTVAATPVVAQRPAIPLPPVTGFSLVQTLTMPEGDRESVHTIREASAKGLRWTWTLVEIHAAGDTLRQSYQYAELNNDLADAFRFRAFQDAKAPEEHPGYTMHAISRAVYRRIQAEGSDSFQIMAVEDAAGGGILGFGSQVTPVRWTGRLSLVEKSPVPFPLLVNARRVTVQALHLRATMGARGKSWTPELWVLADSTYPLLLKWLGSYKQETNVLQTVRVDLPVEGAGSAGVGPEIEKALTTGCRAELPGIYFAFNRADLDEASDRAINAAAEMLKKHPDWTVTVEGHTDSIGGAAANQVLSERRVAAVRERLIARQVPAPRLKTAGFGSARPKESNGTIEGRARNRRVELVRC